MHHMQIQVPIANSFPVQLVLITDSSLAFVRTGDFPTIIDNPEEGVSAIFSNEDFSIGDETYQYNTKIFYKEIPEVLQWIQQQKLEFPKGVF